MDYVLFDEGEVPAMAAPPRASAPVSAAVAAVPEIAFRGWAATRPALDRQEQFTDWDEGQASAGLRDEPRCAYWVASAASYLAPLGMGMAELSAIMTGSHACKTATLQAIREYGGSWARAPRPVVYDGPGGVAGIAAAMPPGLEALDGTFLEILDEEGDDAIGATVPGRLHGLASIPIRNAAALDMALYHRSNPLSPLPRPIAAWERREDIAIATRAHPTDPAAFGAALVAYLKKEVFPGDGEHAMLEVFDRINGSRADAEAYATTHPDVSALVLATALPLPVHPELDGLISALRKRARTTALDARKEKAKPLILSFDRTRAAMMLRARQAVRMARECRKVVRWMHRRGCTGPVGFSWVEQVVTPYGFLGRGMQRVRMVAWPRTAIEEEISQRLPLAGEDAPGWVEGVFFELVGVESLDGHGSAEAWFVEHFRSATTLGPGGLADDLRQRRRDATFSLGLPPARYRPTGLAGACGADEADLMRRALIVGIVLIPIEAFAHGMLLVQVLGEVMARTICRFGEASQIVYDASGWEDLLIRGEAYAAFLAIPKDHDVPTAFPIDDPLVALIRSIAVFAKRRFSIAGPMPEQLPCRSLRSKASKSRFVFSCGARHLTVNDVNYLFQVLTAGLLSMRSHDIRHASANSAKREGLPEQRLARVMRYKGNGLGQVPRYSGDIGEQRMADAIWFGNLLADGQILEADDPGAV